ncbi:MAG: glycosyltransferase family 4 protein [Patescibacteria group bacterium]
MHSLKGLKVGIVCPFSFSYPGGVQEHVRSLYAFLKKKGLRPKILLPRQKSRENYGPDTYLLGGSFTLPAFGSKSCLSFADGGQIQALIEREHFDLLHFHNPFAPFLSLQILDSYSGISVATLHASMRGGDSGVVPFLLDFLNLTTGPKIARYLAVSSVAREVLWKKYWARTTIIPNGVDTRRFRPNAAPREKLKDKYLNILYVGRIDERKGLTYLLDAFKKVQNETAVPIRLLIAGTGELEKLCRQKVKKEKIRNAVFLGYIKEAELAKVYAEADIFCSPAIFGESFGVVLLEAMASGLPVVAFANEGYREVLTGPASRLAVKVKDVSALCAALKEVVENAPLRQELREWGLREVREKYSWDKVGEQVLGVYREALAGGKR